MIVQGSSQAAATSKAADPSNRSSPTRNSRVSGKAEAVQSLEAALEKAKGTRKALAAERVRQLREQMRIMRWFAIASPKTAAQQAARIGKDLAAAVRDYSNPGQGIGLQIQQAPASLEIRPEDDGAAIRQKLRAQLEELKRSAEGDPKDKDFVADTLALRSSIVGLVEVAKSAARKDPSVRRDVRTAQQALQDVSGLLGQSPKGGIGVLNILT